MNSLYTIFSLLLIQLAVQTAMALPCDSNLGSAAAANYMRLIEKGLTAKNLNAEDLRALTSAKSPESPLAHHDGLPATHAMRLAFDRLIVHLTPADWTSIRSNFEQTLQRLSGERVQGDTTRERTRHTVKARNIELQGLQGYEMSDLEWHMTAEGRALLTLKARNLTDRYEKIFIFAPLESAAEIGSYDLPSGAQDGTFKWHLTAQSELLLSFLNLKTKKLLVASPLKSQEPLITLGERLFEWKLGSVLYQWKLGRDGVSYIAAYDQKTLRVFAPLVSEAPIWSAKPFEQPCQSMHWDISREGRMFIGLRGEAETVLYEILKAATPVGLKSVAALALHQLENGKLVLATVGRSGLRVMDLDNKLATLWRFNGDSHIQKEISLEWVTFAGHAYLSVTRRDPIFSLYRPFDPIDNQRHWTASFGRRGTGLATTQQWKESHDGRLILGAQGFDSDNHFTTSLFCPLEQDEAAWQSTSALLGGGWNCLSPRIAARFHSSRPVRTA